MTAMSPAEVIFFAALEKADSERGTYLNEACGADGELRRRVDRLLAAHPKLGRFLEQTPVKAAASSVWPALAEILAPGVVAESPGSGAAGMVLGGRYHLLERIGEGGMGTVWKAQQQVPMRRLVAVKLIKAGMDSKAVLARFEAERQALALMDHPNIARVYDAGATDGGRPYVVMELVEGVPITQFCDEAKLTPRQRLELILPVCQAVQHAHTKSIIHRDLKPSNVLVAQYDGVPVPKVIDFGVAKAAGAALTEKTQVTGFGAIVGTLEYMSPEQAEFNQLDVDTRSDVYSLGVLLYELLTGSPPFTRTEQPSAGMLEMLRVIREQEPTKPSARLSTAEGLPSLAALRGTEPAKLTRLVRGELDWIVLKALEKDRNRRYETASAFAADVQRHLRDEAVVACPASRRYRFLKFVRRNKKSATVAATAVVAFLGLIAALLFHLDARAANARAAEAVAQARADAGERELLLLNLHREMQSQRTHLPAPVIGWSGKALDLAQEIARIRVSDDLRNQAIATLAGPDARLHKDIPHGASAVAWDLRGNNLLIGAGRKGKASLWKSDPDTEVLFDHAGQGPVAFRGDGTAVQLVANPKNRWEVGLWDMATTRQIQAFQIPPGGKAEAPTKLYPVMLALTGDGAVLAAATSEVDEKGNLSKGHLAAWKAGTDRAIVKAEAKVTALVLSPDGTLLAAGDENGRIRFWSLSDGKELEPLNGDRTEIHALAFGRNPHRPETGSDGGLTSPWLLASGASGGTVMVWDLRTWQVKSRCLGSDWDVTTLAFSPDGMTLASAGHSAGMLWDVATGRLLLDRMLPGHATCAAFSPDGRQLAFSSDNPVPGHGIVKVYELEHGRGIQTLRGLVGAITHVRFSADGRWLAALSMNWQVALWDTEKNHLLHVFDVPKGLFADNAALCFSPDGSRFAFGTVKQAKMWEVVSGRELGSWELPSGLVEMLAFRSRDELVSFRMETASGVPPFGEVPWRDHPRVCSLRHLTLPKQMKQVAEIKEFNEHVFTAAITPDGRSIVVEGPGTSEGDPHKIRIYDGTSGKEMGTLPTSNTAEHGALLTLDPTGKILAYQSANGGPLKLVDMPSRTERRALPSGLWSLGPGANYWVSGATLIRGQDGRRLFTIGIDGGVGGFSSFSAGGTRFAWGHTDGSVTVCDIPEAQRRLAKIDPSLGW